MICYDILSEEGNEKVKIEKYRNNREDNLASYSEGRKSKKEYGTKELYTNGELIEEIE